MFKVLEVREIKYAVSRSCSTGSSYSSSVSITNDTHHEFIVICKEMETDKRKRFSFTKGYTSKGYDKCTTYYYGYQGDYNLLIVGDIFTIEKTNTFDKVVIVN